MGDLWNKVTAEHGLVVGVLLFVAFGFWRIVMALLARSQVAADVSEIKTTVRGISTTLASHGEDIAFLKGRQKEHDAGRLRTRAGDRR